MTIKLKVLPAFPAAINGGTGIDATKQNGSVTVDMDWSEFGTISAIPTSPTSNILTFDTATGTYVMVPSHLMGGAVAGIADAPVDGFQYGRQNTGSMTWTKTVPEAPGDGTQYGRQSGAWTATGNFIQAGTGAVTRTMQNKVREQVSVQDFGALGNGIADDTAAIQNAIDSLPARGGIVNFDPGQYKISSPLRLGNGSTAAASTVNGIILRGTSGTSAPFQNYILDGVGARLTWAGGFQPMISIPGPSMGFGVENLFLDGVNVAQAGIDMISHSFGSFQHVTIISCRYAIVMDCNRSGAITNTMNNTFNGIFIVIANIDGSIGILLDGSLQGDTCLNDFNNIIINLALAQNSIAIYLKGCDTNSFRNVCCNGGDTHSISVLTDYTGASDGYPSGNGFFGIDPRGVGTVISWQSAGTPGPGARPNYVRGLAYTNGGINPNLPNFEADLPVRSFAYAVQGQTAPIAVFELYRPLLGGQYRINYSLIVTTPGSGGTIQPFFTTTSLGTTQTWPGTIAPATGGNANGSIIAFVDAGFAIYLATGFGSVTGSPAYSVFISIERLYDQ